MALDQRTSSDEVAGLLGDNYGQLANTDGLPNLDRFIRTAHHIVDAVAVCESRKSVTGNAARLRDMEMWVAAWLYTKSDPMSSSRSGASFVGNPKEPEWYKDGALALDFYGCLAAILDNRTASSDWLGKAKSDQLTWDERN